MKKTMLIALIAAAALAPAAQAQSSYVGASIGRAEQKVSLSSQLDETATSYKVYAGYMFNQNFGIEAGWADHGDAERSAAGYTIGAQPRSLYLAATGSFPVSERFAVIGKIGAASNRTRLSATGEANETLKETTALIGIGATFAITPTLLAVVEYENFGKIIKEDDGNMKLDVLSAGLRYKF